MKKGLKKAKLFLKLIGTAVVYLLGCLEKQKKK